MVQHYQDTNKKIWRESYVENSGLTGKGLASETTAEEQQKRKLRKFENEFKCGEINSVHQF